MSVFLSCFRSVRPYGFLYVSLFGPFFMYVFSCFVLSFFSSLVRSLFLFGLFIVSFVID